MNYSSNISTMSNSNAKSATVQALETFLDATFALYFAAHHHHWNVQGSQFITLHALFEAEYRDAFEALDEIAERIRMLNSPVRNMQTLPSVEASFHAKDADTLALEMVTHLVELHQQAMVASQEVLNAASRDNDSVTEDLAVGRLAIHSKQVWMLNSLLAK